MNADDAVQPLNRKRRVTSHWRWFHFVPAFVFYTALCALALEPFGCFSDPFYRPVSWRRLRMSRVLLQLENYHAQWGVLPYDERGSDYALYRLRPIIPAKYFELSTEHDGSARWDDDQRRIVHSDILYWNQPNVRKLGWSTIYIVSRAEELRTTFVGVIPDGISGIEPPVPNPETLLGRKWDFETDSLRPESSEPPEKPARGEIRAKQ